MSKQKVAIDTDKIEIVKIQPRSFFIDEERDISNEQKFKRIDYQFEIGHGFNLEQSMVKLTLGVEVVRLIENNENGEVPSAKGKFIFDFFISVDNLHDFVKPKAKNKEDLEVDMMFAATITGIAFSTARGLVYDYTKGTIFDNLILPVVNPQELIKGN